MSKRLEAEVWSLDNCSGCGMCVAACSKQVLHWDTGDHPVLAQRVKSVGYSKGPAGQLFVLPEVLRGGLPQAGPLAPLEARLTLSARARGPVKSGAPERCGGPSWQPGAAPGSWMGS
jgi:ferredoxin